MTAWDDLSRLPDLDSPLDENALRGLLRSAAIRNGSQSCGGAGEKRESNMGSKASALLRMLRAWWISCPKPDPGKLEPRSRTSRRVFGTIHQSCFSSCCPEEGRADKAVDLVLQVASRMTDATLGEFVARGVITQGGATTRLAQAFQALVPDAERRPGLLEIARTQVADSPIGEGEGFLDLWKNAADMLTSYSDEQFVSQSYARELSGARTQALEVERVSDDPPDEWAPGCLGRPAEIRALDLSCARPSDDREARDSGGSALPAVTHIEVLLLVAIFDGAILLTNILAKRANLNGPRQEHAAAA